ncbi:MAG: hypothetical protein Q7S64_01140 [bacterium]|nr:hypothetical protein [bacterium]
MFEHQVDTVGAVPEPNVTTLQRGVEKGGSILAYAIAAVTLAIVFGGILTYRYFSLKTQLEQVTQLAAQSQTDYEALKPVAADVKTVNTIVSAIKKANEQQLLYDNILSALAKESLKVVTYKNITVADTGKVVLAGSVDNYNTFAKVVKAFRQADGEQTGLTKEVTINQVTQGEITNSADENAAKKLVTDFIISFDIDTALYKPVIIKPVTPPEIAPVVETPVTEAPIETPVTEAPSTTVPPEVPATNSTSSSSSSAGLLDAFDQSTGQPPTSTNL